MATFTAHSYLHFELPDMPFLDYSRPASSGYHSNAPSAVKTWDVLAIITHWADDADNTQAIDQPRIVRSLRRFDGTAEAAVTDAVQQLLLATSDYVEDQFLAGTSRMFRIESLAHTSDNSVPEIARGRSRFTDKIVYFADEVDKQYKKAILTLELKQPGVLKSRAEQPAPSLSGVWNSRIADQGQRTAPVTEEDRQVDSITSKKLASLICQLWEYMCRFGTIYGALSSGELLYLARREGSELLISPAIHWSDSTPTVLAALAYVFTQGVEDVEQLPLLEPVYCSMPSMDDDDDDYDDDDDEQRDKSKTATDSDETYNPDKTNRKRKRGKPASSLGVTGRLARHVTLRDVPEESLHIEKVIAQGASGNIAKGRILDTYVAIKLAPLASSRGPMLVREAGALLQLRPLWDRYVVGLVDYGTLMDDEYVFIATRLTPGTHPHEMASTPAIKQKALEALRAVHAAGIIHGDVRSENILVLEEESKEPTVMLLDFGAAVRCSKPKWQKEEEAQLDKVFRV